jgi:hypothetical protein
MFVQENDNNAQLSMAAPAVACIQAGLDTRQHAWREKKELFTKQ